MSAMHCRDCRTFLRSAQEIVDNRCTACQAPIKAEMLLQHLAAVEADRLRREMEANEAWLAAEVHETCTLCGADTDTHRAKVEGTCGGCLTARAAMHKRASRTYIGDREVRGVPCPSCGARRGQWCMNGSGAKATLADSPHLGRKIAVLDERQRLADVAKHEKAAIATFGEYRTIDGYVIYPGRKVWNYNLDADEVVALGHVERHPDHPEPAYREVAWWRTVNGNFDGSRLWAVHPSSGERLQ